MRASIVLVFSLVLGLVGCSSDSSLRVAPPQDPTEVGPGGPGGGGGGGGGWPGLPPLPRGPWGELDPGEMPDIYFVVAHGDPGCCWECDGMYSGDAGPNIDPDEDGSGYYGNSDSDIGYGCVVEYAVVDVFGQVVAEFSLPGQGQGSFWSHIRIVPSGPGRFLATAYGWTEPDSMPQTGQDGDTTELPPEDGPIQEEEDELVDEDGAPDLPVPGMYVPWSAWEIDAVASTIEPIAWQDGNTREVVMVGTGRRVDVGPAWGGVQVAVSADDPEWLILWGMSWDCASPLISLRAVHRLDRNVLDRIWRASELLPPGFMGSDIPLSAFALEASIDEDGRSSFLLGVTDHGCGGGVAPVQLLISWSPHTGVNWFVEQPNTVGAGRVAWAGWGGGGALQVENPYGEPSWRLFRGKSPSVEGMVGSLGWGVRPGAVLDPEGPSFALIGTASDASVAGDSIHVVHGGETVWEIDRLRFGLQPRDVTIFDFIVLPPWED